MLSRICKMVNRVLPGWRGRVSALLLMAVLMSILFRVWASVMLHRTTHQQAIPLVNTILATEELVENTLVLPGDVRAWHEAPIYARSSGYLKQWYVDIGDKVLQGAVLAEIDAPELDAEWRKAEADLRMSRAQYQLATITATRWMNLLKTGFVSKQATDEKVDTARALLAGVKAARANRDRLSDLVDFKRITAPFSGTISDRSTDIGDLINAGNDAKPLFRLVQTDRLRVYVHIPQNDAFYLTPKMAVTLRIPGNSNRIYNAQLLQTAKAIDPKTRTLLAQFVVNNPRGELLAGSYANVYFTWSKKRPYIQLPVNALLFRSEGLQVATLDKKNRVALKSITIASDFGTKVAVTSGISVGDRVVINPPDTLVSGQIVNSL